MGVLPARETALFRWPPGTERTELELSEAGPMGTWADLKASDGHAFKAFYTTPQNKPVGGLVLLPEIFGVNAHIRGMAERYAVEGYQVLAPALFDRVERNLELDYGPESMQKGRAVVSQIPMEKTTLDVEAAVAELARGGQVGVLGYCWGGSLAWRSSQLLPVAAAVGYYGGRIPSMLDQAPGCPVMLHFAEQDEHIPLSDTQAIRERYPEVEIFTYPADHGFNCDQRSAYDPASAQRAWNRSLAFLHEHVGK